MHTTHRERRDWPLVSIVVSNYDGVRFGVLEKCLHSLSRVSYPQFELLVVDNCSDDESLAYLQGRFQNPPVTTLRHATNNYSEGLNLASKTARGEYLLYLNNDTEVDPRFIQPLVESMENRRDVGLVQCKLLDSRNPKRIDSLGERINFLGYHQSFGVGTLDRGKPDEPFEVPCANGSAFMIRKELLLGLGGFDNEYYSGYEDVDLSLGVRTLGYAVLTDPRSVVYHSRGTTLLSSQLRILATFHFSKNRLVTLLKFYQIPHLFLVLPTMGAVYLFEFAYVTVREHASRRGLAKIRAFIWVCRNFRYVFRERERMRKMKRVDLGINFDKLSSNSRTEN
jgi:GT2 family glycosyltransferase